MKNKEYIKFLERKVAELISERDELRDELLNTLFLSEEKPFDVPQYSIELKLPGEIPSPFMQKVR